MSQLSTTPGESVRIAYRSDAPPIRHGATDLIDALEDSNGRVATTDLADAGSEPPPDVAIVAGESDAAALDAVDLPDDLGSEGFAVRRTRIDDHPVIRVAAAEETGAMYGALDLAEQVRMTGSLSDVEERTAEPAVPFRAIKFNLPWFPYRDERQTEIHYDTCRDLDFWEAFLDMMARNRFNALTLWNLHPFPHLVKPEAFPEASPFTDEELAEWQAFWHDLFGMAADRGIETYLVNWNIHTTPEFAEAHGVNQYNDPAGIVREYTRACVTEVIDEYPELTGLGTSVASWMEDMTPEEKHDWIEETWVAGIEDASRPIKLIHRSIKSQALDEMRRVIEAEAALENVSEVIVPSKFNWSHGHSTTDLGLTHDHKSGDVDDRLWNPPPEEYDVAGMIRNEDFFILRWGDPDFVRDHIAANFLDTDYAGGYFVGSEGYIPALDLSHESPHEHQTWQYAFEKQWLFYAVWGRLLYDPETPDAVFEHAFAERYGEAYADRLLEGYRAASRMPLELAKFHAGTWDYTLYAEGFLAPIETLGYDDGVSHFISIEELIDHETLDPDYLSIPDYLEAHLAGEEIDDDLVTPLDLADRMEETGDDALAAAESLAADLPTGPGALECEVADIEAWGHLSRYFAAKLRAGVEFETYRLTEMNRWKGAVDHLRTAADHWDALVEATSEHYQPVPYANDHFPGNTFSWEQYTDQVERDIAIVRNARPYDYESP